MNSDPCARRHLRFGWWMLLFSVVTGAALEAMHGFKLGLYLDVGEETRRMMWRLGHAHGTFLSMANIVFALTAGRVAGESKAIRVASPCFVGATIALPGGFLLGGFGAQGGDPGPGIFLAPLGAVLLVVAVGATAWHVHARTMSGDADGD